MITDALDAFILHWRYSGETSAYVTFFTREKGLIKCLYKGARSPKKQAALQAFTPLWLDVFSNRNHTYWVRQLEVASPSFFLTKDSLFAGLYVNELLYHTLSEQDAQTTIYDGYVQTLQALSDSSAQYTIELILRRFEWALLCASGTSMSFTQDALGLPIHATCYYQLGVNEGFVKAEHGILGAHIIALAADCIDDVAILKSAKKIMRLAIQQLLGGKVLKVRELYLNKQDISNHV